MDYGILFAILSPLFSSTATVFQTEAAKLLTPLVVVSIGGILGSITLFLMVKISGERIDGKTLRKNWKDLVSMTMLRPLFGGLVFAYGLSMTNAIKAVFFTKVEPYFVLGWHWFLLKEKIQKRHLILLAVHVIGAIILSTGGRLEVGKTQMGDFLIVVAMGLYSLSYIYGNRLARNIGAIKTNALTLGITGLVVLPFALLLSESSVWTNSTGWTYLILYIVLFNVIGLTLWYASLKSVKGWIVAALRSLGPLVGVPLAWFLFGETLTVTQMIGGIIVLITSALIAKEHLSKNNKKF